MPRPASLKKQLTACLVGLFTLIGLLASGLTYNKTLGDTNSLLDHELRTVADSIDDGSRFGAMQAAFSTESPEARRQDVVMQAWLISPNQDDMRPDQINTSRPGFDLPKQAKTGFSDVRWNGEIWRVCTIIYSDRTVQVSQRETARRRIAAHAALDSLTLMACLIPVVWLLTTMVIDRLFRPLDIITRMIVTRNTASSEALPSESLPVEITPFVDAINGLLLRLHKALDFQKQFVSDAAHELRTPLMALRLQIDSLTSRGANHSDYALRLLSLSSGINRATHLVGQLLKMARYEYGLATPREVVDLSSLLKSCIASFLPFAEGRSIDLGLASDEPVQIMSNAADLRTMFNNLIDNAIRYTPAGGTVDVSLTMENGKPAVSVQDTGPGIPESAIPKVFDRFFRIALNESEGSGIGLALVKAIAEREPATIILHNRTERSGLIVKIIFS